MIIDYPLHHLWYEYSSLPADSDRLQNCSDVVLTWIVYSSSDMVFIVGILNILFLEEKYELAQFHFHWASSVSGRGSEHTHDGKHFFAEVSRLF